MIPANRALKILYQDILSNNLAETSKELRVRVLQSVIHYILDWLCRVTHVKFIAVYHYMGEVTNATHVHTYKEPENEQYTCYRPDKENTAFELLSAQNGDPSTRLDNRAQSIDHATIRIPLE